MGRKRKQGARPPGRRGCEGLRPQIELFVLEYLANGQNGSAAYRATHPRIRSDAAARAGAYRLLTNAHVKAFVEREQAARRKRLQMDGDEALEAISRHARADFRKLFDPQGRLLPVNQWPDEVADCVKAVKPTAFGTAIVLYDKLRARELMAIAGGKLKQQHQHTMTFDHEGYLADKTPGAEGDP